MKGTIYLYSHLDRQTVLQEEKYELNIGDFDSDYSIQIITDFEEPFDKLVSDEHEFVKSLEPVKLYIDYIKDEETDLLSKIIKEYEENEIELLQNAEFLVLNLDDVSKIEYIKNNNLLEKKKVILRCNTKLDENLLEQITEVLGSDLNNLYFRIEGNQELVGFTDCKNTYTVINKVVNEIEKFNFSPLEKIMYAYDFVRSKIYVAEGENESSNISRDLTTALLGDKIVCVGYANIFDTLLIKLGIKSDFSRLKSCTTNSGHVRNLVYIDDDKYQVHGAYYFDTTWDSQKVENDNSYLYSYKYFAKTKLEIDELTDDDLIEEYLPYFSDNMAFDLEEEVKENDIRYVNEDLIRSINYMSNFINGNFLISPMALTFPSEAKKINVEDVVEKTLVLTEHFNTPLTANILLQVLFNVRKQQYYMNPEKYPFDINDFAKTAYCSNWEFELIGLEILLAELIYQSPKSKIEKFHNDFQKYKNETTLEEEIKQVQLTKTLRKVLDKKNIYKTIE